MTLPFVPKARIVLWVASLGGLALAARSVFLAPVPMLTAALALSGYLALVLLGVLFPQLEMFGDVFWRGDPASGAVALTFDDGPHPETTPRVLRALREAGVTATFFVIGEKALRYPDVVRALVEAGHTVASHGFHHRRLYSLQSPGRVRGDLERSAAVIEQVTGTRPRWFRPPVGQVSPRVAEGARRAGIPIVAWSVRGLDGLSSANPARVLARLVAGLAPGAILQLHDASEREGHVPASLEVLPQLLEAIRERGLRVVSLDELSAGREG